MRWCMWVPLLCDAASSHAFSTSRTCWCLQTPCQQSRFCHRVNLACAALAATLHTPPPPPPPPEAGTGGESVQH